jgi:hypothetical protein
VPALPKEPAPHTPAAVSPPSAAPQAVSPRTFTMPYDRFVAVGQPTTDAGALIAAPKTPPAESVPVVSRLGWERGRIHVAILHLTAALLSP